MKVTDEILNRFIDGELNSEELKEFKDELNNSRDVQIRLRALQAASVIFKNIIEESPTVDFTSKLMLSLHKKFKARKRDSIFIASVASIFVVISLLIIGYILAQIISAAGPNSSFQPGLQVADIFEKIAQTFVSKFSSSSVSIVGTIISFGVIVSGYFYFDFLKSTRSN